MPIRLAAFLVALSAVAAGAEERTPFTVDTMWAVERVGPPAVSPDGRQVAYALSVYDAATGRLASDLWVAPVAGGTPRRLTGDPASDASPAWSPDGRRLAFVSRRDGDRAAQIYLLDLAGGDARRLTDLPLGVSSIKWFPDGRRLAFVSAVSAGAASPEETRRTLDAREKQLVKARVSENRAVRAWDRWLTDDDYPHLFTVDVESGAVVDLLPDSRRLFGLQDGSGAYTISPDGATIVFQANATDPPFRTLNQDLFAVPSTGGAVRVLTADNPADDTGPVFSPDGRSLAYGREAKADGFPDYTRLAVLDVATGRTRVLTDGWEYPASGWTWTRDGRDLVFHAEVRARVNLYGIPASGGAAREIVRGGTTSNAHVTAAGEIVYLAHAVDRAPEIAAVKPDGSGRRWITAVNDALLARTAMGTMEEMTFAGAGGDEVQMFVVYPPGFDRAKKYPLVHLVHGGPVGTFGDAFSFRWHPHAFAAPGYVVAMVNFHGSSSFGQAWVESILGAHPDKPFTDIMKATDHLIAQGFVDPDRLAAAGGSYGGFLVNWIAGHTTRFKALVSHAGVYNLPAQWASDFTWGRHHSYGGYTFTDIETTERWSPHRYASGFATPMLVLHGERDFRVPVTQGLELYGVLAAKGVPARLVYYPDENHWILRGPNAKHWYGEVHAWLAKHLR